MPGVPSSNIQAVNNLTNQQPSSPAQVGIVIGPANAGTVNALLFEPSISQIVTDFQGGPMPEVSACALREVNPGTVGCVRTTTSTLGVASSVTKTFGATAGTAVNLFGAVLVAGAGPAPNGDVLFQAKVANAELEIVVGGATATLVTGLHVKLTVTVATTGTQLAALITGVPAALALWSATALGTGANVCGQTLATYNEIAGRIVVEALTTGQSVVVANNGASLPRSVTYGSNTLTTQLQTDANSEPQSTALDVYNDAVAQLAANPGKIRVTLAGSGSGLLATKALTALSFGSTGAMTVSGNPNDAYQVAVKIVRAGALGTAAFQYSLGGANGVPLYTGETLAIPAGGIIVLPGTGLTLTFTGSFDLNDVFAFTTTAPLSTLADISAALTALITNPNSFSLIAIAGSVDAPSIATWNAALATLADQLESTGKKFVRISLEVAGPGTGISNTTWANNLITLTANVADERINWFAGDADIVAALPVPVQIRVAKANGMRAAWARLLAFNAGRDVGDQSYGQGLSGVIQSYQSDVASILAQGRFSYLYTLTGIPGVNAEMRLFDSPTGDYVYMTYGRLIDLVEFYGYINQTKYLNTAQRRQASGAIDPAAKLSIENTLRQILYENVVKTGNATAVDVVVDGSDTQNRLKITYFAQPLFYVKTIDAKAGVVITRTVSL